MASVKKLNYLEMLSERVAMIPLSSVSGLTALSPLGLDLFKILVS